MEEGHVVILPFPAQGHVKPMLMLAQLLCDARFHVTFVNTHHNHHRLLRSLDQTAFSRRFPRLRFAAIPDGLPPHHPRPGAHFVDLFFSTRTLSPDLKKLLLSLGQETPPTCLVADGIMSFAIDVAEELRIPIITFRTYSACCTWVYFHISKLIQDGHIPFKGDDDMDAMVGCIPGLEKLLRRRDLPSFCRYEDVEDPVLQFYIAQTRAMTRASALILNTFHELEAPIISRLAHMFPKIYTIGPLHARLPSSDASLAQQDTTCLTWLHSQPSKSVIYVSFGSVVTLTRDQLLEFWHGLLNSGKPFLWVVRRGLLLPDPGDDEAGQTPPELLVGTRERGCIVEWAPQEEVLAHPSVGGFLTHSGWNSTLESILAGIPVLCWPQIADQPVNSRCASDWWRIGLDMKDTCDRSTVEKMVTELMETRREEFMTSTAEISRMARESVNEGGSSHRNLEKLVDDIRSMTPSSKLGSTS